MIIPFSLNRCCCGGCCCWPPHSRWLFTWLICGMVHSFGSQFFFSFFFFYRGGKAVCYTYLLMNLAIAISPHRLPNDTTTITACFWSKFHFLVSARMQKATKKLEPYKTIHLKELMEMHWKQCSRNWFCRRNIFDVRQFYDTFSIRCCHFFLIFFFLLTECSFFPNEISLITTPSTSRFSMWIFKSLSTSSQCPFFFMVAFFSVAFWVFSLLR